MTFKRFLLCTASCSLLLFVRRPAPAQSSTAKDATDQEVLKRNEECNAAELRADIKAMDDCETADFTHTHASGQIEEKTGYLAGRRQRRAQVSDARYLRPSRPLLRRLRDRRGAHAPARG